MATATLNFPESLTEAYKPKTIDEFIGLSKQKAILSKLAANPRPCALLFLGGPGVGKTSMAFSYARQIDAEIHHVTSGEARLETLQSIAAMCHRVPYDFQTGQPCKWHAIILDEADLISSAGQNFLLSRLDGSQPCPATVWLLTANSIERFEERFLSRLIQLPKFTGYSSGSEVRVLLSRIWNERMGDAPEPDYSKIATGNVRAALQWLETEMLCA